MKSQHHLNHDLLLLYLFDKQIRKGDRYIYVITLNVVPMSTKNQCQFKGNFSLWIFMSSHSCLKCMYYGLGETNWNDTLKWKSPPKGWNEMAEIRETTKRNRQTKKNALLLLKKVNSKQYNINRLNNDLNSIHSARRLGCGTSCAFRLAYAGKSFGGFISLVSGVSFRCFSVLSQAKTG